MKVNDLVYILYKNKIYKARIESISETISNKSTEVKYNICTPHSGIVFKDLDKSTIFKSVEDLVETLTEKIEI